MRWTAIAACLTAAALVVAAGWMRWVIRLGSVQVISIIEVDQAPNRPVWWGFQYAAALLVALILAVAAIVIVNVRPPASRNLQLAIGVIAGLEVLVFGVVWFSLAIFPLSSP